MSERTAPAIDRTIYSMPMFATFQVSDIAAAEEFYQAVGFVSGHDAGARWVLGGGAPAADEASGSPTHSRRAGPR